MTDQYGFPIRVSRQAVNTDEQALCFLPSYPLVLEAYQTLRTEGFQPEIALTETLALWRQFMSDVRPNRPLG